MEKDAAGSPRAEEHRDKPNLASRLPYGEAIAETFRWDLAGNQPRPAELGQQPGASLAWRPGNRRCEA
jgi:hypothetical protein